MHHTDTLAQRLRALADEIESAERYGLPIPPVVTVTAYRSSHAVCFAATPEEFAAWADYTEADVMDYQHDGVAWQRAEADVNGLGIEFATHEARPVVLA